MSNTNLPAILNTLIQKRQGYDLEQVVDWAEKFNRQREGRHPPFNPNELVRVKGFIEYGEDGLKLHVDADGRVADNFYLANPVDPEKAKKYSGLPLESIVRILGFRQENFQLSNIQNYDAGLLDITSLPLINPNPTEVAITGNTQAVIYGEFIGFKDSGEDRFLRSLGFPEGTRITGENSTSCGEYTRAHLSIRKTDGEKTSVEVENPPRDYHDRETYGIIRTDDEREIEVHMPTGKTVFSGGTIENINGKLPAKGDVVRISTRISRGEFFAHWCDPCFLVDPSEARYSRSENLRLTLDHNLDRTSQHIEQGNYADARKLLAEVRAKEVTDAQLDRTYELFQRMPEDERPVLTDKKSYCWARDKNYEVSTVDRHYGVRLEAMTRAEFVEFAKGALSGEIEPIEDHAETSYFFRMLPEMGFDSEQIEELAVHAIQGRIQRMKGKERPEFADEYVLGYAVNTIYHEKTPNAARIISETVSQLHAAGLKLPYEVRDCSERLLADKKSMIEKGNV